MVSLLWCAHVYAQTVDLEQLARKASAYEAHLAQIGPDVGLAEDRHLAQLEPLLPQSIRQRITGSQSIAVGPMLAAWWRRQDPLPASPANERMLEHLRRVAYAEEHFACSACASGFDARGDVYVRYGAPERTTEITFDDPQLIDAVFQPGVAISPGDFPDNVFWRYLYVDRDAYFLFVRDRNGYRQAQTSDLLPTTLRSGFQPGGRGLVKSQMALAVMRAVYRQLALEHPHFGARYNDVDLWLSARESTGRLQSRDLTDNIRVLTGADLISGAERSGDAEASATGRSAHEFVQAMLSNARTEDQQIAYQQEILLPKVFSDIDRTLPELQVAARHARFLDHNGETRTEVYWGFEPGTMHPASDTPGGEYLLHLHARQLNADYTLRRDSSGAIRIQAAQNVPDSVIPPQTLVMMADSGVRHVSLQWDQYRIAEDGVRSRIQAATVWIDSLQALDGSGFALEMSDLKPVSRMGGAAMSPYPYMEVAPDMELGLYFEVYHLIYDRSGETRYTITYEITSSRGRRASSVTSSYRGSSRTAREDITLDLSEQAGNIRVKVTVQDDVSGASVDRAMDFTLIR